MATAFFIRRGNLVKLLALDAPMTLFGNEKTIFTSTHSTEHEKVQSRGEEEDIR